MATVMLVHGFWHGNWCWREFADRLRGAGHDVHATTLTGHDRPTGKRLWYCIRDYVAGPARLHVQSRDLVFGDNRFGAPRCRTADAQRSADTFSVIDTGHLRPNTFMSMYSEAATSAWIPIRRRIGPPGMEATVHVSPLVAKLAAPIVWSPALSLSATPSVDEATFRTVMASVCTPVAIVTAMDGEHPHGTTVSAFASLSLRPPMVLIALDRGSELLRIIRTVGSYGVNVLSAGQDDVAQSFSRKGSDRFVQVDWRIVGGLPRLAHCAGWLACAVTGLVDGGDHIIALGRVLDAAQADELHPLTYHRRGFGTHAAR